MELESITGARGDVALDVLQVRTHGSILFTTNLESFVALCRFFVEFFRFFAFLQDFVPLAFKHFPHPFFCRLFLGGGAGLPIHQRVQAHGHYRARPRDAPHHVLPQRRRVDHEAAHEAGTETRIEKIYLKHVFISSPFPQFNCPIPQILKCQTFSPDFRQKYFQLTRAFVLKISLVSGTGTHKHRSTGWMRNATRSRARVCAHSCLRPRTSPNRFRAPPRKIY